MPPGFGFKRQKKSYQPCQAPLPDLGAGLGRCPFSGDFPLCCRGLPAGFGRSTRVFQGGSAAGTAAGRGGGQFHGCNEWCSLSRNFSWQRSRYAWAESGRITVRRGRVSGLGLPGSEGCMDLPGVAAAGHTGVSRGRGTGPWTGGAAFDPSQVRGAYQGRREARGVPAPPLCAGCRLRRDLRDWPSKEIGRVLRGGELVEDTPAALWARYGPVAGLSREALFRYLNGVERGLAIQLGPFRPFADGLSLPALGIERPPQSFRYFPDSALAGLVKRAALLP